ncbi:MAG: class I SAM-dependent methyltransferase [Leeuwenhoekiella sp.]
MSNKEVTQFYNNYNDKHIKDYLMGNKRLSSAITNLLAKIPTNTQTLLDVGCGIGWSSHEFARHLDNTKVIGIDLSPQLIGTARKLFKRENLEYQIHDVSQELPKTNFDIMVLIDVYEHISVEQRGSFHAFIKNNIADGGRLLIACPSVHHQSWLRKNRVEGLQPIDEDITIEDLKDLASFLDGELTYFEYKNIWNNCDYFHAVIQSKVDYAEEQALFLNNTVALESKCNRIKRVENDLKNEFDVRPFKAKNNHVLNNTVKKIIKALSQK